MAFIDTSWVLSVVAGRGIDYVSNLFTFEWGGEKQIENQTSRKTHIQTKTKNSVPVDIKWFS